MAVYLNALLVLTTLTGIHSSTSVSKVPVMAGGSISIPCLYSTQYADLVKYLCKGYYWAYCKYVAQTNQRYHPEKFSISDDKKEGVFTMTIKQLTNDDSYFWCSFEHRGGSYDRTYFELSVTSGTPSLSVDNQEVTGFTGGHVTINCHSASEEITWCRIGRNCVQSSSGFIDGTAVNVNKTGRNDFAVTMSGLRQEDSGWYYCASGDLQMPVRVTVTEKPTTSVPSTPTDFEDRTSSEMGQHSTTSFDLKMLIIPLSLLILIVIVTLLVWFMLKRKRNKAMAKADEEVTYSNVTHKRKPSAQVSSVKSDVDILYASVVVKKKKAGKRQDEANGTDVTYSTLAAQRQQHI